MGLPQLSDGRCRPDELRDRAYEAVAAFGPTRGLFGVVVLAHPSATSSRSQRTPLLL